jgi:hypothetical protein
LHNAIISLGCGREQRLYDAIEWEMAMTKKTTHNQAADREAVFEAIAREHLRIETLKERKSDSLDFHEVAVWALRDALAAAFEAGRKAK